MTNKNDEVQSPTRIRDEELSPEQIETLKKLNSLIITMAKQVDEVAQANGISLYAKRIVFTEKKEEALFRYTGPYVRSPYDDYPLPDEPGCCCCKGPTLWDCPCGC